MDIKDTTLDDLGKVVWGLRFAYWGTRLLEPIFNLLPSWLYSPRLYLVAVETTTECTRKCVYCPPHYSLDIPSLRMEWETYRRLVDSLAAKGYRGFLAFNLYGESLLDDRLEAWISHAASRVPAAALVVFTNGDRLTVDRFLSLRKAGMRTLVLSQHSRELDGAVLETLKTLKRDHPDQYCVKLYDYYALYHSEGNKLGVLNNRGGLSEVRRKPLLRCHEVQYAAIDCHGNVLLCCNDCTSSYKFGNVAERDFYLIWNDPAFVSVRRRIMRGQWLFEICRKCMSDKGLCTAKPGGKAARLAPAFHDLEEVMASLGAPRRKKTGE